MKKIKHDHKGTKLLKLGIFASLMLAPLLAIAFKCAYVTFNKNAKDSYSSQVVQKVERLDNATTMVEGLDYTFHYDSSDINSNACIIEYNSISINWYNYSGSIPVHDYIGFYVYGSNARFLLYYYDENNARQSYFSSVFASEVETFTFNFKNASTGNDFNGYFLTYTLFRTTKLDDAFYYAIDEMKNNELFNWTTNTALYTPTAAMTNGMGITTNALPILITYWLYLTAIYIVIDIVVELFTALTHMITSRIEQ